MRQVLVATVTIEFYKHPGSGPVTVEHAVAWVNAKLATGGEPEGYNGMCYSDFGIASVTVQTEPPL